MSRVRFQPGGEQASWLELRVPKPAPQPDYTGNTMVTEWLTLACRGAWASHAEGRWVRVRFSDPRDAVRAKIRFGG